MADLQKTVEIIFGGRNDLTKTIGEVEKSLSGLNTLSQPFAELATDILKVEAAVLASLGALGTFSIREAGGFADGMAEIRTLLRGITDEDFANFTDEIRDLARNMGFSLEDILGATYQSLSQGVPQEAVSAFLKSAQTLADAGGSTLGEAVDILAGTANAYGMELDKLDGLADIFFDTVVNGKTTIPELASAMGQVTSVAAPFGVEVNEVAAAIAALTAYGVPSTSEAATIIRNLIQGLVNPTDAAAKAAADLGISLGAEVFKNKTFPELMQEIGEKTGFSAGKIADIFSNTQALKGALPLINDPAKNFAKAIDDIGSSAGSAARAALIMADTYGKTNQILINNMRDVLIGVGIPLLDEYKHAVGGILDAIQAVGRGIDSGAMAPLTEYFSDTLKEVGDFASKVAAALPDAIRNINWEGLTKSFDNLKDAVGGVFDSILGDVDLTTAAGLEQAIQGIIDAFAGFNNLNAGIISTMTGFFDVLMPAVKFLAGLSPEQFELLGKALGSALLLNIATGTFGAVAGGIGAIATTIKTLAVISPTALLALASALGKILAPAAIGFAFGTWLEEQVYKFRTASNDLADVDLSDSMMPTFDNQSLIDNFNEIESTARQVAFETGKIPWELDADGNIAGTVTKITDSIESITKTADPEFEQLKGYFISLGNSPQIAASMARIELETQRIPKALEDAVKETGTQSDALTIELAKVDAAFATRAMELTVDMKVAQVEAETKQIQAAFSSIDNTITSTGETLASLTGNLTSFSSTSSSGYKEMLAIVQNEERRRDDSLELQKDLTKAQVDLMKARTARMNSGDAMITINGDGLAPQLEAFMWEVLRAVQIQAADEESAFLLGVGA